MVQADRAAAATSPPHASSLRLPLRLAVCRCSLLIHQSPTILQESTGWTQRFSNNIVSTSICHLYTYREIICASKMASDDLAPQKFSLHTQSE
jgi:hypothetical protein